MHMSCHAPDDGCAVSFHTLPHATFIDKCYGSAVLDVVRLSGLMRDDADTEQWTGSGLLCHVSHAGGRGLADLVP